MFKDTTLQAWLVPLSRNLLAHSVLI